jgi:bifunctional oligoribonuclease and PAP phosphatase NrnA
MADIMNQIAARLLRCQKLPGSVYLYPHVGVDGDSLGTCLALLLVFRKAGIPARLLLDEPVPYRLTFLPNLDLIEPFSEGNLQDLAADQQLAMAVDCSDGTRTGRRQALFDRAPQVIVLDHHVSGGESGPLRCIDATAAAVGEMAFDLIRILGERLQTDLLDLSTATLLMAAIVSDTGGFVFANTSARTFKTAACLMTFDVDLRRLTYHLFDLTSQARLRLMGRLFSDARFLHQGKLAIAMAGQLLLEETGASDADLEGVINYLRNAAGVEAAFLIREMPDGSLRVNIRGSDRFDAAEFAGRFGGGGHPRAAGLQLSGMTLDEAASMIAQKAGEQL